MGVTAQGINERYSEQGESSHGGTLAFSFSGLCSLGFCFVQLEDPHSWEEGKNGSWKGETKLKLGLQWSVSVGERGTGQLPARDHSSSLTPPAHSRNFPVLFLTGCSERL